MKFYRNLLMALILTISFMMATAVFAHNDNLIFNMDFENVTDTTGNWNVTRAGNGGSTDNGIFTAATGTDSGSRWDITLKDGKSFNLHDDSIENITYEVTFKTTAVTDGKYVGLFSQKFFTNGQPTEIKATDGNDETDFNGAFHLQLQPNNGGYHYLQVKLGDASGTAYLFNGAGSGSMKFFPDKWYQLTVTVEKNTTTHKAYVTVYNRDMQTGSMVKETKELAYSDNPYLDAIHPLIFGKVYRGANFYGTPTTPQYDGSTYLRDVVIGNAKIYNKALSLAEMQDNYSDYLDDSQRYGFTSTVQLPTSDTVFKLDYSNYSDSHNFVTDITGKSNNVTIQGGPKVETYAETGKKYLQMASAQWGSAAIVIDNPEIRNLDEMTIEVWAKIPYEDDKNTGRLVCFGEEGTSTRYFDVMPYGKALYYRPALDGTGKQLNESANISLADYNDKWTHYVFTRKWNAQASTWVFETYVNGEKKSTKLSGELEGVKSNESTAKLIVGNSSEKNNAMVGGIGNLTVYNKVLSQAEVDSKYIESMSEYVNSGDIVFDVVAFDNGKDKIESLKGQTAVNANISAANNSASDEDAVIFMAVYGKNNALKKLEMKSITIKARKNTKETISFETISPEDGDFIKVFVWEDLKTMEPMLSDQQQLPY